MTTLPRRFRPSSWKGWALLAALVILTAVTAWRCTIIARDIAHHSDHLWPLLIQIPFGLVMTWVLSRAIAAGDRVKRLEKRLADLEKRLATAVTASQAQKRELDALRDRLSGHLSNL